MSLVEPTNEFSRDVGRLNEKSKNRLFRGKVKGSTLMETLVATVLIVVLFMVSSMILNNLFVNNIQGDMEAIDNEIIRLEYLIGHGKLELPYYGEKGDWSIAVTQVEWRGKIETHLLARNEIIQKELEVKILDVYEK